MAKYKVADCKTSYCPGEILFRIENKHVDPEATWLCKKCNRLYYFTDFDKSEFREKRIWLGPKKPQNNQNAQPKSQKATGQPVPRTDENSIFNRLNFLYFAVFVFCLTLFFYIFKLENPIFESHSSAFLFSIIILTFAGFYYYFSDKRYFASFGILILMTGVIGQWQYGPSDIYLIVIITGVYSLIIAFIPALLGIPLLLGGAYYLIASLYQAFRLGISYIAWYYWPASLISILIGLWLVDRQKNLN